METNVESTARGSTGWAALNILLGIWFFVSPWIYGAASHATAWNCWIAGALIAIVAAVRITGPAAAWASWVNMALGAWVFVSPWVFNYTAENGRLTNSLCVGILVFLIALSGHVAASHPSRAQY